MSVESGSDAEVTSRSWVKVAQGDPADIVVTKERSITQTATSGQSVGSRTEGNCFRTTARETTAVRVKGK
ncbi:hypothetical protein GCM10025794_33150 [Massilia kyonggiensis]